MQPITRRGLFAGAAAGAVLASLPMARAKVSASADLVAGPAKAWLAGTGKAAADVWAYNGSVPGTVLRGRQGEPMHLRFRNGLAEPSAVHWHGLRIANAMDGVPGLTQDAVAPGAGFDYAFTPPDAGTFWYHPHARSYEQVPRGLAGALVVEERDPPKADQDLVLLISDWRLDGDGQLAGKFGARHDQGHAGRLGNLITVNGVSGPEYPVRRNERIRLRLINAATARVLKLRLEFEPAKNHRHRRPADRPHHGLWRLPDPGTGQPGRPDARRGGWCGIAGHRAGGDFR